MRRLELLVWLSILAHVPMMSMRGVAVGRKNYLFAGSDRGAERAAAFYTLIETAKLNGLDTEA